MAFNLNKYKKDKPETNDAEPDWVTNGSDATRKLYYAVVNVFGEVEKNIRSGIQLEINQRRIVNTKVAKYAGVDKSNISKRRQPYIVELINELDEELSRLWKKSGGKKSDSGKKLSKEELQKENIRLKRELVQGRMSNQADALMAALESELLVTHSTLAKEIARLKKENTDLHEETANLRSQLRKNNLFLHK